MEANSAFLLIFQDSEGKEDIIELQFENGVYLLSPRFLEKASGILLSPPSVCPSVRLSVMLSPPKPLDRIQPNLVSGLLTQVGHARARLFLALPPGALGRGQKVKY